MQENYYNENEILNVPDDNIIMDINFNGNNYIVFTDSLNDDEMNVMIAKIDFSTGKKLLKAIENQQEYEIVFNEFTKRLVTVSE